MKNFGVEPAEPLGFENVLSPFAMLFLAAIISILIMILENLIKYFQTNGIIRIKTKVVSL